MASIFYDPAHPYNAARLFLINYVQLIQTFTSAIYKTKDIRKILIRKGPKLGHSILNFMYITTWKNDWDK